MKVTVLILSSVLLMHFGTNAQSKETIKAKNPFFKATSREVGITLASDGSQFSDAIHIGQYWGLGKGKRKFKVGLGLRMTNSFGGNNAEYLTAPAKLTSGKTGPGVFFADQVEANLDTLKVGSHNVNALNFYVALHYDFTNKLGCEFNIDAAGISFGGSQDFDFLNTSPVKSAGKGKPTFTNALLISDNDYGTLNSELMFFYKIKPKLKVKAGGSFLFKEYRLESEVRSPSSMAAKNDRFRNKSLSFGVGVNYQLK